MYIMEPMSQNEPTPSTKDNLWAERDRSANDKESRILPPNFVPSCNDVICGRGSVCFHHIGNIRFRYVIKSYQDEYEKASTKACKTKIICQVIDTVHQQGGIFLRQDLESGRHYEVSKFHAREKTSQAFRAQKHESREPARNTTASLCQILPPKKPTVLIENAQPRWEGTFNGSNFLLQDAHQTNNVYPQIPDGAHHLSFDRLNHLNTTINHPNIQHPQPQNYPLELYNDYNYSSEEKNEMKQSISVHDAFQQFIPANFTSADFEPTPINEQIFTPNVVSSECTNMGQFHSCLLTTENQEHDNQSNNMPLFFQEGNFQDTCRILTTLFDDDAEDNEATDCGCLTDDL